MIDAVGWTHEHTAIVWQRKCIACGSTFNVLAGHRVADCARVLDKRNESERRAA